MSSEWLLLQKINPKWPRTRDGNGHGYNRSWPVITVTVTGRSKASDQPWPTILADRLIDRLTDRLTDHLKWTLKRFRNAISIKTLWNAFFIKLIKKNRFHNVFINIALRNLILNGQSNGRSVGQRPLTGHDRPMTDRDRPLPSLFEPHWKFMGDS